MLNKIDIWSASVTKMEKQIEMNAGEILTY